MNNNRKDIKVTGFSSTLPVPQNQPLGQESVDAFQWNVATVWCIAKTRPWSAGPTVGFSDAA